MRKILLGFVVAFILSSVTFARSVSSVGYGNSSLAAERDALRNAVENVVSVALDNSTQTSNNKVIEDSILTHSIGYVTNYTVVDRTNDNGTWRVLVDAEIETSPKSKLMTDLVRLGVINLVLENPCIGVLVVDKYSGKRCGIAETVLQQTITDFGFQNSIRINCFESGGSILNQSRKQLSNGLRNTNVNFLIFGEVEYESHGDVGDFLDRNNRTGMIDCLAKINAKMFSTTTGRIVGTESCIGKGLGISTEASVQIAIRKAAKSIAEVMATKLLDEGAGCKRYFSIVVKSDDFAKVDSVRKALSSSERVKNVQLKSYKAGIGIVQLLFKGSSSHLVKLLNMYLDNVDVESVDFDKLIIIVK